MKKLLMLIGLTFMLAYQANATNYYVRSDAGNPLVWSSTSNPSDIFTFDSAIPNESCGGCVSTWPADLDYVYNYAGVELVINEDCNSLTTAGNVVIRGIRANYTGSKFTCNANLSVSQTFQIYDATGVTDSYFKNLEYRAGGSGVPTLYGTFTVANLTLTAPQIAIKSSGTTFTTNISLVGLMKYSSVVTITAPAILLIDRSLYSGGTYDATYDAQIYAGNWMATNKPLQPGPQEVIPSYGRLFPDGGSIVGDVTYSMAGVWNDRYFFPRQTSRFNQQGGTNCCNYYRFVQFGVPLSGMTPLDLENEGMLLQGVAGMTDPYVGNPTWEGFILQEDTEDYPTFHGGTFSAHPGWQHVDSEGQLGSTFYIDENVNVTGGTTQGNHNSVNMTINQPFLKGTGYVTYMMDANHMAEQVSDYYPNLPIPHTSLEVTGTVDFNSFGFDVTYTSTNAGDPNTDQNFKGRNLVSNPFLGSIKWGSTGWISSNISPTIYMSTFKVNAEGYPAWNVGTTTGGGGKYDLDSYNFLFDIGTGALANGVIPVGGAFYVEATGASPSLTVTSAALVEQDPGSSTLGGADPNQGAGAGSSMIVGSMIKFNLLDDIGALVTYTGATNGVDINYDMKERGLATAGGNYNTYYIAGLNTESSPAADTKMIGNCSYPLTNNSQYHIINLFVKKELADVSGAHFSNWEIDLASNVYGWFRKTTTQRWNQLNAIESSLEGANPDYFGDCHNTGTIDYDSDGYVFAGQIMLTYGSAVPLSQVIDPDQAEGLKNASSISDERGFHLIQVDFYDDYNVVIMDASGKTIHNNSFSGFTYKFNSSDLAPGVYIYRLESKTEVLSGRFIKQ